MIRDVLVINRAQDSARYTGFCEAAIKHGVSPRRIEAIDAHAPGFCAADHAELIGPHFWGRAEIKPGALGCFLSHRRAWQYVAEHGCALICEDDARLTAGTDGICSEMAGADLLFCNDRLGDWARAAGFTSGAPETGDVVSGVSSGGGLSAFGLRAAPGADAYILTPDGAKRLLEITATQRIVCGVDWAMLWAGFGHPNWVTRQTIPELVTLGEFLAPVDPPVATRVLANPISCQAKRAPSVLSHFHEVPITELLSWRPKHDGLLSLNVAGEDMRFLDGPGDDPEIARLRRGESMSEEALRTFLSTIPARGTLLDIGAGAGLRAAVSVRAAHAGRVVLFEPMARRALSANVSLNGIADVAEIIPEGIALGAAEEAGWLIPRGRRRLALKAARSAPKIPGTRPVEIVSGDRYLADTPVDVVCFEIDFAAQALEGLTGTLSAHSPTLLVWAAEGGDGPIASALSAHDYWVSECVGDIGKRMLKVYRRI